MARSISSMLSPGSWRATLSSASSYARNCSLMRCGITFSLFQRFFWKKSRAIVFLVPSAILLFRSPSRSTAAFHIRWNMPDSTLASSSPSSPACLTAAMCDASARLSSSLISATRLSALPSITSSIAPICSSSASFMRSMRTSAALISSGISLNKRSFDLSVPFLVLSLSANLSRSATSFDFLTRYGRLASTSTPNKDSLPGPTAAPAVSCGRPFVMPSSTPSRIFLPTPLTQPSEYPKWDLTNNLAAARC